MKAAFFILPLALLTLSACDEQPRDQSTATTPIAQSDATQVPPQAPQDSGFTYQGKPIDPICFNFPGDASGDEPIDLATCTGSAGSDEYSIPENGLETFDNGAIGYTFKCEGGCMRQPFVSYKHLGQVGDAHAVMVESSGGGTGVFTTLALYQLADGKLTRTKAIAGGDRCNGGIENAVVKDNKLHFSMNITPFDMIEISKGNDAGFEAYDDIQACAVCCVGQVNYVDDQMVSVTLTQDPKEIVNEDLGPKDACFFGTYNETYFAGKTTLDQTALNAFGQTFHQRCGDLAGKELPPTIPSGPDSAATPSDVDQPVPVNP